MTCFIRRVGEVMHKYYRFCANFTGDPGVQTPPPQSLVASSLSGSIVRRNYHYHCEASLITSSIASMSLGGGPRCLRFASVAAWAVYQLHSSCTCVVSEHVITYVERSYYVSVACSVCV